MDWIEEIDDILAEVENTVKGEEGDKVTKVRGIIQDQRKSGQVDAIVMLREKIAKFKNAYEEAEKCSDMLLSNPTSNKPAMLMDDLEKARNELFKEAT